jgi:hypothetical protein
VIAVRLPNSIATCACGEWLSGSKAAPSRASAILTASRSRSPALQSAARGDDCSCGRSHEAPTLGVPRSIRVIAAALMIRSTPSSRSGCIRSDRACRIPRGAGGSGLSIRLCSISLIGSNLVVRDANRTGHIPRRQQIKEAITDGMHLLRVDRS